MTADPSPLPLRSVPQTSPARREQPIERAARLIAEGRVTQVNGARVYEVQGDHGTYRVIVDQRGIICPCEARTPLCAHVIAVAVMRMRGKPSPERLISDLGLER